MKANKFKLSFLFILACLGVSACDSSAVSPERSIELGNHQNINQLGTGTGNAIVKDVALYVNDEQAPDSGEFEILFSALLECKESSIEGLTNLIGVQIVRTMTLSSESESLAIDVTENGIPAYEALALWANESSEPNPALTCQVDVYKADDLLASGSNSYTPTFTRVTIPGAEAPSRIER